MNLRKPMIVSALLFFLFLRILCSAKIEIAIIAFTCAFRCLSALAFVRMWLQLLAVLQVTSMASHDFWVLLFLRRPCWRMNSAIAFCLSFLAFIISLVALTFLDCCSYCLEFLFCRAITCFISFFSLRERSLSFLNSRKPLTSMFSSIKLCPLFSISFSFLALTSFLYFSSFSSKTGFFHRTSSMSFSTRSAIVRCSWCLFLR
mmetsp:Transcript_17914/g.37247  ORF Transcript_17914/g.37247 Transcript_17914/m.37247 type:complete len:203 (-) Transcript_17914:361-969(-)